MDNLGRYFRQGTPQSSIKGQRGLTLIEIIIVLVIIGLATGMLMKGVFKGAGEARKGLTETKMNEIKSSVLLYQMRNNSFPQDLNAVDSDPDFSKDAWGHPVQYRLMDGGRSYELKSLGGDGREGGTGGDGDIVVKGP
jgi:general secretion pathway protein G